MVSHDEKAAFEYADKKITLEEGLVIKEEIRDPFYENKLKIEDGICYLPFNRNLTEEETKTLSEQTKNGSIKKLVQNTDGFYEFKKEKEEYNYLVKPTKFSKDAKLSLIEKYSRKDLVKSPLEYPFPLLNSATSPNLRCSQTFGFIHHIQIDLR